MKDFNANQVINGTWGQIWYDGEYMAELKAFKAEVNYKKTAVWQEILGFYFKDVTFTNVFDLDT